jgi:hypothetical protein
MGKGLACCEKDFAEIKKPVVIAIGYSEGYSEPAYAICN